MTERTFTRLLTTITFVLLPFALWKAWEQIKWVVENIEQ